MRLMLTRLLNLRHIAVAGLHRPGTRVWRLWQMVLGWGCVGLVYTFSTCFTQLSGQSVAQLPPSALDQWIAFLPSAVWGYLSFFAFIPWAYLAAPVTRVVWLRRTMQLCALVCGVVYLSWPTELLLQPQAHSSISAWLLARVRVVGTSYNSLPSLHGALTVLAMLALVGTGSFRRNLLAVIWAVVIAASVVLVRQHILIDLLMGIITGGASGLVVLCVADLYTQRRRPI